INSYYSCITGKELKKMIFKITLEAARVMAGLSVRKAAKCFGVHHETLSRWEKDPSKMKQRDVEKIAEIYGIPAENIFFGPKNEFIRLNKENALFSLNNK
ncbi:helix-turn-helix transcriptional regulator, partial [Enterococcus sp.]|uniref:helix-turn-helix transcriptional regulator n=1 Tax=Enterococcus sp. TaxID=35783 RepID=UPI0025B9CD33